MRHVELAQQLAQQVGIVIVVVDVWQELAVGVAHHVPLASVEVGAEEPLVDLVLHVVIHVLALGSQVHLHLGLVGDGCELVAGHCELVHS